MAVMKYENIKNSLQRVLTLLEDGETAGLSAVEFDLILSELRNAYSELRFGGQTSEPEQTPQHDLPQERQAAPEPELPAVAAMLPESETQPQEQAVEEQPGPCAEAGTGTLSVEEEMQTFFKSDEESQSRRRMFVRSLYDEQPAEEPAPAEPQSEPTEETTEPDVAAEEPAAEAAEEAATEPEGATVEDAAEETVVESVLPTMEERHHTEEPAAAHVLGEVINADVQTFADTIAPAEDSAANLASRVHIGSLTEAIGINDRFLLIRDLFDNSPEAFEKAISKLDSFDNLNDCMVYILENYDWDPYCDGAKLLMPLIERRYGNR